MGANVSLNERPCADFLIYITTPNIQLFLRNTYNKVRADISDERSLSWS